MIPVVIIGGLVIAKIGFGVADVVTSPTCATTRKQLLTHARSALAKLNESELPTREKRKQLRQDIALLAKNDANGWRLPAEHGALCRVVWFVITSHASGTGTGAAETATNYFTAMREYLASHSSAPPEESRHS